MENQYGVTRELNVLSPEYKQFQKLVIQFMIDQYIRNESPYCQCNHQQQKKYIEQAINDYRNWSQGGNHFQILTAREIREEIHDEVRWIMKEVNQFAENKQDENYQKRFYWLKKDGKVIGFQKATIEKRKDSTIGWRNLAYTDPNYAGKIIEQEGQNNKKQNILVTSLLYHEIDEWFNENKVTIEKTLTGIHMLSNIQLYMIGLGFMPIGKKEDLLYFQKEKNNPYPKQILKKIYQMYEENERRNQRKSHHELQTEIEQIKEFKQISPTTKQDLVGILLKEEEKGGYRKFRESLRLKEEDKIEDKRIEKNLRREENVTHRIAEDKEK